MYMQWLKVLHLVGGIVWLGASVAVGLVAAAAAADEQSKVAGLARRVARRVVTPGLALAFIGGLTMLALGWGAYARAGWMHAKLLVVIIAAGLHGALSAKLRKAAEGQQVSGLAGLSYAFLVLLTLIVVLVLMGPTWMPARVG